MGGTRGAYLLETNVGKTKTGRGFEKKKYAEGADNKQPSKNLWSNELDENRTGTVNSEGRRIKRTNTRNWIA